MNALVHGLIENLCTGSFERNTIGKTGSLYMGPYGGTAQNGIQSIEIDSCGFTSLTKKTIQHKKQTFLNESPKLESD